MFVFWYKDTFIRLRFNVTAILGEILVLAAIVVGFVQIFACGYTDEPILPILATASCIYLLNRYVYYPLCIRNLGDAEHCIFLLSCYLEAMIVPTLPLVQEYLQSWDI